MRDGSRPEQSNELSVGASLESLASIGAFVLHAARNAGLNQRATYRLRLAVDEMATNVIVHGGPLKPCEVRELRIVSALDEHALTITLEDQGPEFNPLTYTMADDHVNKPTEQRSIGGLGVFLALRSVDRFHYERKGDRNRCIFIVTRGGVPGAAA
jgi:anti-sigma regulatory factor (Ser/Thr protein kinase)